MRWQEWDPRFPIRVRQIDTWPEALASPMAGIGAGIYSASWHLFCLMEELWHCVSAAAKARGEQKHACLASGPKMAREASVSTAQSTPFSGGSVVSRSPACFSSVWYMTHHIPEKRRISCYHLHRVRIHSWQNAAVLSRMRMSRRSRRAAASWLIFSYDCAVSEVEATNSMRLKSCSKIAVAKLRRKPASTPPPQLKSREML